MKEEPGLFKHMFQHKIEGQAGRTLTTFTVTTGNLKNQVKWN